MIQLHPFYKCPRWSKCSVNNCPLDPKYPDSYTDSQDTEKACTLPKGYRLKVAEQFPNVLQCKGLTKKEFACLKSWNNLPDDEKARRKTRAKNFLFGGGFQKDVHRRIQTPSGNRESLEDGGHSA